MKVADDFVVLCVRESCLVVVAFEAKGMVATTKDEQKKLGLLLGWDEPEIQGVRCKRAAPDLFRIS